MEKLRELDEIQDIKIANGHQREREREKERANEKRIMVVEGGRQERGSAKEASLSVRLALGDAQVLKRLGKSWEVRGRERERERERDRKRERERKKERERERERERESAFRFLGGLFWTLNRD